MSDVAHILGIQPGAGSADANPSPFVRRAPIPEQAEATAKPKKKKISRERAGILGKDVAAAVGPQSMVGVGT